MFIVQAQPNQIVMFEDRTRISGSSSLIATLDGNLIPWDQLEYRILESDEVNVSRTRNIFYFTNLKIDEATVKIRVTYVTSYFDVVINLFLIKSIDKQWIETEHGLHSDKKVGIRGIPDTSDFKVHGDAEVTKRIVTKDLRINNSLEVYGREGFLKAVDGVVEFVPMETDLRYTNPTPMPEKVGGYIVGSTFDNVDHQTLMDGLLYPYQEPVVTSFSISDQGTTLECGVVVLGASRTFVWGISNPTNVKTNSMSVLDVTGGVTLGSEMPNSGSAELSFTDVVKTVTNQTHQWRVTAMNTKNQEILRNYTITWLDPFYYGVGAPGLTVAQVQGLTKDLVAKGNRAYAFNPVEQVYYLAYPAVYGDLVSILDTNGFEILSDFTKRMETFTQNGTLYKNTVPTSYLVYEFKNLTTQTNFNITFKFS